MQVAPLCFISKVENELNNSTLQENLRRFSTTFVGKRAQSLRELDNFEELRTAAAAIRDQALQNLNAYLTLFEERAQASGAVVLWAETPEQVNQLVLDITVHHDVKKVIKSKSMVSEESHLDQTIEAAGIQVIESDLGEYILQLNDYEPPSHIVAPALHKTKQEVAKLFSIKHRSPVKSTPEELTHEARNVLRQHFLTADMGISGGNFLVAETGSVVLVTNEGNATLGATLPPVHVVITGIEKIVPTLEDVTTLLRLLPRSALGQPIVNYVDIFTGVRKNNEPGPQFMYFILVDSGRTDLLNSPLSSALRCIRCGACMQHCPVYQHIGGHSYGWVYPGPIGSILTPMYRGLQQAIDLPHASTLCDQCGVVCPVKIPLPDLQRKLREMQTEQGLRPWHERLTLRVWAWLALHPTVYSLLSKLTVRFLALLGGKSGLIHYLPIGGGGGWTIGRDMPAPEGQTFLEQYRSLHRQVES